MPGISGYVRCTGAIEDANALVCRVEKVHRLPNITWVTKSVQSKSAIIINMLTGLWANTLEQPATDPEQTTILFLEGQLFNWEEIRWMCKDTWARTPCEQLVALFLERGPHFISLLDGEFNLVIYQPAANRLLILNDQLASKPFYCLAQPQGLLFGSEKKALLALADPLPDLDPVGLIQIVAYRHHVGGRTLHKGVTCLPPATILEYCDSRVKLTRYVNLHFQVRTQFKDMSLSLEEWAQLLRASTQRRVGEAGRLLLSLSGGLDSRAVACAISQTHGPLFARTRGEDSSAEVEAASAIAKSLGFTHHIETPGIVPLSTILPQVVWRSDGAIPFTHGVTTANHACLKKHADFMAGGWFGDASSGAHLSAFMLMPYTRVQFLDKVHHWYAKYHKQALNLLFQPSFVEQHMAELSGVFFDSFEPITSDENWQAFELWDLQERQTRMTFCAGPVDSHLFELVRPFLDLNYLQFTLSLPPYLRYGQVMYQAMIYHLGPEIRHVPYANTGLQLKGTIRGNMINRAIARTNRVKVRLREKLAPNRSQSAGRRQAGGLDAEIRQDIELRHRIESFVESEFFDSTIFNRAQIQLLVDQHYAGARDYSYPISMLATLAVALPTFIYQRPSQCPADAVPIL
jgi:hypothetical protein